MRDCKNLQLWQNLSDSRPLPGKNTAVRQRKGTQQGTLRYSVSSVALVLVSLEVLVNLFVVCVDCNICSELLNCVSGRHPPRYNNLKNINFIIKK